MIQLYSRPKMQFFKILIEKSKVKMEWILFKLLQEGGPLPEPETGLLSNTRKWIVRGDACADKARDFIGKGRPGGEQ